MCSRGTQLPDSQSRRCSFDDDDPACSIAAALGIVGDRWTILILRDAFRGLRRFDELRRDLDIPRAVLSDRLRRLVEPACWSSASTRSTRRATSTGSAAWACELSPILVALMQWGDRWCRAHPTAPRPCSSTNRAEPRSTSASTAGRAKRRSPRPTSPAGPDPLAPADPDTPPEPTWSIPTSADLPLDELMAAARAVRDDRFGTRITYSPKVFIPLTMLCRDKCGYCTFAQPPARLDLAVPGAGRGAADRAQAGARQGCHEALFTLGERPGAPLPRRGGVARRPTATRRRWTTSPRCAGSSSTRRVCCPTPTPERSSRTSSPCSGPVAPSQGMMIESLRERPGLPPGVARQDSRAPARDARGGGRAVDRRSPPASSSASVRTDSDRIAALEAIAESHRRHGHVQEVIVQNFLPKDGTAMHRSAPCPRTTTSTPSPWPG